MTAVGRWRRRGLLFAPGGERPWLHSHATLPLALRTDEGLRVYFASRDKENRSHIGFVDLDPDEPTGTARLCEEPALEPGPLGCFDDHGVYPTSIVSNGGKLHLYYVGWNPGKTDPLFYSSIGLAVSDDGGRSFHRTSPAPLLARSEFDPCMVAAATVLLDDELWRMWYVSGFRWDLAEDGTPRSWYHLKYAESDDGLDWRRQGRVCIDHEHPGERNISRACVLRRGDTYQAWYAYAGDFPYRIGYAESRDGLEWTRMDDRFELKPPAAEWDSVSQAYPWVFEHDGATMMLYNGNDHGMGGFGLAVEEG